jgi:hypothetical protein
VWVNVWGEVERFKVILQVIFGGSMQGVEVEGN